MYIDLDALADWVIRGALAVMFVVVGFLAGSTVQPEPPAPKVSPEWRACLDSILTRGEHHALEIQDTALRQRGLQIEHFMSKKLREAK